MKKAVLIVLIAGMASWAVYDFVSPAADTADKEEDTGESSSGETAGDESDEGGLSKGDLAPDFELKTLKGDAVRLSDYQGERVIVNFWASWCAPCRDEIPDLQKLYDNKDVEILAVNLTRSEESQEKVRDFVDNYEMSFPKPMDKDGDVAEKYKVRAYPTSYMINSDGRIQFKVRGPMPYDVMTEELAKIE
ncbi:redoxin domain-containing protein [Barrientosiimonas marina]|uniref:TlpA family protein disulfide reductase n=1 Tax=Lentibacillus kimchii TaxID=1542911 RepID=A0ABW2UR38_9BACI